MQRLVVPKLALKTALLVASTACLVWGCLLPVFTFESEGQTHDTPEIWHMDTDDPLGAVAYVRKNLARAGLRDPTAEEEAKACDDQVLFFTIVQWLVLTAVVEIGFLTFIHLVMFAYLPLSTDKMLVQATTCLCVLPAVQCLAAGILILVVYYNDICGDETAPQHNAKVCPPVFMIFQVALVTIVVTLFKHVTQAEVSPAAKPVAPPQPAPNSPLLAGGDVPPPPPPPGPLSPSFSIPPASPRTPMRQSSVASRALASDARPLMRGASGSGYHFAARNSSPYGDQSWAASQGNPLRQQSFVSPPKRGDTSPRVSLAPAPSSPTFRV